MSIDCRAFAPRFRFNERLVKVESEGFTRDDWTWRPSTGGNPAIWILGHVASYRRTLLRKLGAEIPTVAWEGRHARGASNEASLSSDPAELLHDLEASGWEIERRIEAMTQEDLKKPWGGTFPDGGDTLAGGISFLYFHETYHLGQLGYLRRLRGKPGFA